MSKEGDRQAVFRTTQVRAKLKGDASWLQRRSEPEGETQQEKPWMAEVRAGRTNGEPVETSPVTSPVKPAVPSKPPVERTQGTVFRSRGIYSLPDKVVTPTTTNGLSKTTQFTKKPSESYKKLAAHTVKTTSENQEVSLSPDEQEKRVEVASKVLNKSSIKQQSYVLSAAKKLESKEQPDSSLSNNSLSFVAKRVEITNDDEIPVSPPPASVVKPLPAARTAPAASAVPVLAPKPTPRQTVNTSVTTTVIETVNDSVVLVDVIPPKTVEESPASEPVIDKEPIEDTKPDCTKVATPLPELITECMQAAAIVQAPEDSNISKQTDTLLVDLSPSKSSMWFSPTSAESEIPAPVPLPKPEPEPQRKPEPEPEPLPQLKPKPIPEPEPEPQLKPEPKQEPEPEPQLKQEPEPEPEPEPAPKPDLSSSQSMAVGSLVDLSDTLLSFSTTSSSIKNDEPALAKEDRSSEDPPITESSPDPEAAVPRPTIPASSNQELLLQLYSESSPTKASRTVDRMVTESTVITSVERSFTVQREDEKKTDEKAPATQSHEDNADPWSSHVTTTIVTTSSSADPFDPYPIGTTSSNSSTDLLQQLSSVSNNRISSTPQESLADDVFPNNPESPRLISHRSWARTWESDTPRQADAEEESPAAENEQTLIKFERKSSENDSPWDRWTSPTVYTITTTTGEEEEDEEEEEERPGDSQTVTTITTIREIHTQSEPIIDRYETYSTTVKEEEPRVQTPEPESKKGFVYVKEYINATEMSSLNSRDSLDHASDYLTSSSIHQSYSSPYSSRVTLSSTCNYCGEQVGDDCKITIEHLGINCHPDCFKCGVCERPMGDLLHSMFIHGGIVHCESCYANV
uniref:LIM zinc-binding domain-containing protein n=1 Tax=Gouania willdenowi TaxID=441366 RepID=A0A8C5ECI3_GOUWI